MTPVFVIQRTAHPELPFAVGIEIRPGQFHVSRHWRTRNEARQDAAAMNKAMRDNPKVGQALSATLTNRKPRTWH
jgi:hypothetical protein